MTKDFQSAYLIALRFLKFRPRSVKEIEKKLKLKNYSSSLINQVIKQLLKQKFLDDHQFAQMWINHRHKNHPMGQSLLKLELLNFGIDRIIINQALEEAYQEFSEEDEINQLIDRKIKRYENLPSDVIYRRMASLILRRGYRYQSINQSLKKRLKKLNQ